MSRVISSSMLGSGAVRRQRAFTKEDFIKAKILFRVLFLVAFMAILSLFIIWSRVQIVQVGYEINTLNAKERMILEENKKIQVELATLKSPQRVQDIAVEKLKMGPPSTKQVRILE